MLWMFGALLLVLWLSGMVAGVGAWIHVALAAAIVTVVVALARPNRYDSI